MILNICILVLGLILVVVGADFLVEGASSVARKLNISEFVIGLTIVGFGTSCPELVVSSIGALNGSSDIAVGNVIGSNIFNTLLILGLTAIIMPIRITSMNRRRDIPVTIAVTLVMLLLGLHESIFGIGGRDVISRADGIILLTLFCLYIFMCFKWRGEDVVEGEDSKCRKTAVSCLYILGGLAALIAGGRMFVDGSVSVARNFGISEKFIAITLLAGGTSLPELATSIVAASKGKGQMALGNILGSNVFNILLILGVASIIQPVSMANINWIDVSVLVASVLIVGISSVSFKKDTLDRVEGAVLVATFLAYYAWLFYNL